MIRSHYYSAISRASSTETSDTEQALQSGKILPCPKSRENHSRSICGRTFFSGKNSIFCGVRVRKETALLSVLWSGRISSILGHCVWSGEGMEELKWAILCTVVAVGGVGLYWILYVVGAAEQRGKRAVELGGGSLSRNEVAGNYKVYSTFFQKPKEIEKADNVPKLVDTFYNLVTDIYEWGWGQSFHFSPAVPGKSYKEETRLHEERVADLLGIKAGDRLLDAGCGVGGPMRAIAAYSSANVVGITINDYQVERARSHNKKAGLDGLCEIVCGNFLHMPFEDESFDGAYSIEATCHAPQLEEVYAEIYRVLKPGQRYVTYEWVTTPKFDPDNAEHVEIIHGIEHGDALPGLRNYKQVVEIAKSVGFDVLEERDLALPPAHPWWSRLKMGRFAYYRNHLVIALLSFLGIAPQGVVDVHEMLFKTADFLTRGGETGIFTPMHLMICQKPDKNTM